MKNKTPLLLALVLASGAFALPARADLLDNVIVDIRLGVRQPPPPPAVVVVVAEEPRRGPDRWEQRDRWYARNQAYYYYPGGNVYYRQADHVWFYQDRGQWRSGRNLPDNVRLDFNHSVSLNMYTDRPYTYNQQVVARYPSNYFGARVRVRDDDRHDNGHKKGYNNDNSSRGNDHDGRDSDHDGRDKDKGNRK